MDSLWLEDFLVLTETLNFSRAAALRNVTQPAFSRRIRALEQWIGAELFIRTTHNVTLTPGGVHFRDQAAFLLRAIQQLRRDTQEISARRAAHVTIAATHALSFTFFPRWVRSNPQLLGLGTLNLISDSMQGCEQLMLRGEVQFLLCHSHADMPLPLDSRRYASKLVGHDILVPLSAPGEGGAPRWTLIDGQPTRRLAYSAASGLGRILAAVPAVGETGPAAGQTITSHLAATLLSLVRDGEGLAWLPRSLAEEDITAGRLVQVGESRHEIPVEIRLYRAISRQSEAVEAVWSHLP